MRSSGKRRAVRATIALTIGALSACTYVPTRVQYQKDVDYSAYRTYALEQSQPTPPTGPLAEPQYAALVDRRARAEIVRLLAEKGLEQAPPDQADLAIGYYLIASEEVRAINKPGHQRWLRYELRDIEYHTYLKGTIVVDMADQKRSLLVWHGTAEATVRTDQMPTGRLEKALQALLGRYPPYGAR